MVFRRIPDFFNFYQKWNFKCPLNPCNSHVLHPVGTRFFSRSDHHFIFIAKPNVIIMKNRIKNTLPQLEVTQVQILNKSVNSKNFNRDGKNRTHAESSSTETVVTTSVTGII